MSRLVDYLQAAERENTRRSYASAIRHFEVEWKGLLPATGDSVAQYLSDHAETLSMNTLRHRLAALSRWHSDQGFSDPTKQPLVRQVLKGIRALHPSIEKRARPLQLEVLQQVCDWLDRGIELAREQHDHVRLLRLTRDRALLLLGFWRGFRADELVHLQVEHLDLKPGEGLTCYLPRSKGDRQMKGRRFSCPALSRLCPVAAMEAWLSLTALAAGPVFCKIDRWGHLRDSHMQPNSVISLLRRLFSAAGVETPEDYSSHSLRRGFAEWSRINGWDFKELMEYVGWRDLKSAMRYLESSPDQLRDRFEQGLPPLVVSRDDSGADPSTILRIGRSLAATLPVDVNE
jgi:integrase